MRREGWQIMKINNKLGKWKRKDLASGIKCGEGKQRRMKSSIRRYSHVNPDKATEVQRKEAVMKNEEADGKKG